MPSSNRVCWERPNPAFVDIERESVDIDASVTDVAVTFTDTTRAGVDEPATDCRST